MFTRARTRWTRKHWLGSIILLLLVWLMFRWSVFSWYRVSGVSMHPTLRPNDIVAAQKLAYGFTLPFTHRLIWQWQSPKLNDIVVFWDQKQDKVIIKRVVGLPGDILLDMKGNASLVPEGHVSLEGDNPQRSYDSRYYGSVATDRLIGRVPFFLFSPSRHRRGLKYLGKPIPGQPQFILPQVPEAGIALP